MRIVLVYSHCWCVDDGGRDARIDRTVGVLGILFRGVSLLNLLELC